MLYGVSDNNSLEASYKRAFKSCGHEVFNFDTQSIHQSLAPWLTNRLLHRFSIKSLQLRRWGSKKWNRRIIQVAQHLKPNMLFLVKGYLVMPETLQRLRDMGIIVFLHHPDNPFPPFASSLPETLLCAREVDCYFIWSRFLQERLQSMGIKRVEYLPFAWDPDVFPYAVSREPHCDLIFIGGWDREREALLTSLAKRFDLKIWGPNYWKTRTRLGSPLRTCWQGKALHGSEAATEIQKSKIVLNILRQQNLPDGTNMRTFEVPGAGGFLLSNRSTGAMEVFEEGRAGAYFGSTEDMMDKIDYFLRNDSKREEIAHEAHIVVELNHRYKHRAIEIIKLYYEIMNIRT